MSDVFGKLTDILVFCVVGFILPAFLTAFLMEEVKDTTASITVRELAEDVAAKGYLDKERYEAFLLELNAAGVITETEICAEHDLLAPEYKMRSIEDMESYLESLWSGSNILNQPTMTTQRPSVTDPGSILPDGIAEYIEGENASTSGPSAEHNHGDLCYVGVGHTHSDECYTGTKHVHSGDSAGGTGCYTRYVPGEQEYCGVMGGSRYYDSYTTAAGTCSNCEWGECRVEKFEETCSGCRETWVTVIVTTCMDCGYSFQSGNYGETHYRTGSVGHYEINCGKTEGKYYNADGTLSAPGCGKEEVGGAVKHEHTGACETTEVNCPAGCSLHTHSGSSSSGTGCYTKYVAGSKVFCGYTTSPEFSYSVLIDCYACYNDEPTMTESHYEVTCNECGDSWLSLRKVECSACGYSNSYGSEYSQYHYVGESSGYYEVDCGKDLTKYYDTAGNVCEACNGTGKVSQINCTLEAGKYYDRNGNEVFPACNRIVTGIAPIVREQIVSATETPDFRVKAVFADGHSEVVTASVAGFNSGAYNTVQTVILSYGEYAGSLDNPGPSECTVKRLVRYPTKTCAHGHLYYLVSRNTTPCPYCYAYPKTLAVQGVEELPFRIRKGSTLRDNGVFLKVTYYDGRAEIVRSGFTDTLDKNYVGEQTVTIGYGGATTTLLVYTGRIKVNCSVCGYEYQLYPDDTDPGCPKCLAAVPEFTGNVLRYKETVSYGEILDELYYGDGICYFSRGDRFEIELWKNSDNMSGIALGRIFHADMPKELVAMYGVKIRDEETEK